MNSFDNLPKRDHNHTLEDEAEVAFQALIVHSSDFILQRFDRKDYGTDCQIEVVMDGQATNVRLHVQLKGTERDLNTDGSLSIAVKRTNLNYLIAQPYSFYVAYHVPTKSLRVSSVEAVLRQYEHNGGGWTEQQSLTVSFTKDLTLEWLYRLANLALSNSRIARDRRIAQMTSSLKAMPDMLRATKPDIHVPEDANHAGQLAKQLYESGEDDVLNAAFEQFHAVLGADHDAMVFCYMSEVNLGMRDQIYDIRRIEAALKYLRSKLATDRYQVGSLQYTMGNALSVLGREKEAKTMYSAALDNPDFSGAPEWAAQCHKNLGTSLERLGNEDVAVKHYLEALRLNPSLPEAHAALAHYYYRNGQYEEALQYFDHVVLTGRQLGRLSAISGWRTNILFILGNTSAAFREINVLLSIADSEPWIWPWCARQVAAFGRISVKGAKLALAFWDRFISTHIKIEHAYAERLMTNFYLRSAGEDIGEYAKFRSIFYQHIALVDAEDAALLWDRLGHWAQDEGDWEEAERCYRKAYDLAGGHYGYCLGTALNFLDRFEESRPILVEQAEHLQPDAMSWFQLGVANGHTGRSSEAIAAYEKAIMLDPDYSLAMFNLGGVYWNDGKLTAARQVWRRAIEKFPNHELAEEVRGQ